MFLNDDEFAAYKAVELEGAVEEIMAQRSRTGNTSLGGLGTMSSDDVAGVRESGDKRVTMWIDKVSVVVFFTRQVPTRMFCLPCAVNLIAEPSGYSVTDPRNS